MPPNVSSILSDVHAKCDAAKAARLCWQCQTLLQDNEGIDALAAVARLAAVVALSSPAPKGVVEVIGLIANQLVELELEQRNVA